MRVVTPPIEDLSDLGEYIEKECEDKATYRLEKATDRSMFFGCSEHPRPELRM
jgi:hypothetical protein